MPSRLVVLALVPLVSAACGGISSADSDPQPRTLATETVLSADEHCPDAPAPVVRDHDGQRVEADLWCHVWARDGRCEAWSGQREADGRITWSRDVRADEDCRPLSSNP